MSQAMTAPRRGGADLAGQNDTREEAVKVLAPLIREKSEQQIFCQP
jgi:hypothetical protein